MKYKIEALIVLRDSGMGFKETAESIGIHPETLRRWKAQYYNEVFKNPSEVKIQAEKDYIEVQHSLMGRYRDLLGLAADRFEELIPKTKNLDALQKATLTFAKLARFIDNEEPKKPGEDSDTSPIQFFQQINQHYINKYLSDEKKTIDISGDPEE